MSYLRKARATSVTNDTKEVIVCTLCDGTYGLGAGVLLNSLVAGGFRGRFVVGYRGEKPSWSNRVASQKLCSVVFLEIKTDAHLTNYKPAFLLDLFVQEATATHLIYIDPDVVFNGAWQFVLDWLSCGIALCEDVNSPIHENHPRRIGWRRSFGSDNRRLTCKTDRYVNGGFIGVSRESVAFIRCWQELLLSIGGKIGGLNVAKVENGISFGNKGFAECFDCSDQDALNAAIEASNESISILPRTAMGFAPGDALLPHAVGPSKPWQRSYVFEALRGVPPRFVDKKFWARASTPLQIFSPTTCRIQSLTILFCAFLGRFYKR